VVPFSRRPTGKDQGKISFSVEEFAIIFVPENPVVAGITL